MKLGIFSDVHGNLEALEAVLGFLRSEGVSTFVCCGDIVGYGADPAACVHRVAALRGPVVAGNHDWGVLGRVPIQDFNSAAARALEWTKGRLADEELVYLDSLPLAEQFEPFYMVHSSPSAPEQWEYVFMLSDAREELRYFSTSICLIGHSHYPFMVEQVDGAEAVLVRSERVEIRRDAKYLVNVGSVGQPRDGDPRATCVMYDTNSRSMSLHRLDYDRATAQRKILTAGLPAFLAERLAGGR